MAQLSNEPEKGEAGERDPSSLAKGSAFDFLRFSLGYWRGRTGNAARGSGLMIVAILLANLAVNYGLNRWHRWFFDALEQKQPELLLWSVPTLAGIVITGAAFAVAMIRVRMALQIGWRRWVTEQLLKQLVHPAAVRDNELLQQNHGSPAYRIAEDVRFALDPIVELAVGFCNASILGATFLGILIYVGGSMRLEMGGVALTIPAYLAVGAVVYALVVSSAMFLVGRPLVRRIAEKNEAEARFLFELSTAAEPSGIGRSIRLAHTTLRTVVMSWRRVVREYGNLTWISNSSSYFAPALPLLLTTPKYIAGDLSLGAVMQLATAFTVVLGALNWMTDNYVRIAEWSASARRVDELRVTMDRSTNASTA